MTELIPGIHQMKLPIPWSQLQHVNAYLIRGDNQCLLIDTGHDNQAGLDALRQQMAEIDAGLEDITQIIATHAHSDHYGMAGRLQQLTGAQLGLHYLEARNIESASGKSRQIYQQTMQWLVANGMPPVNRPPDSGYMLKPQPLPDIRLQDGDTISVPPFHLRVLWTPGHARGHICLYEPSAKIIFSGDHVLPTITPNVSLHSADEGNPLGDYLQSLDTVYQLEASRVLPAHENPFTGLQSRINQIIEHHEERKVEIAQALSGEAKPAYQICMEITW